MRALRQNGAYGTMAMRGVLRHTGAAIAVTVQVASGHCAEIPAVDNLGFSAALAATRSYESNSYDFGSGSQNEATNAEPATDNAQFNDSPAPSVLSTTRMLRGRYEFSEPSWQFEPSIGANSGMVDTREKLPGYTFRDWAAYRGGAATFGLPQVPSGRPDNNSALGWKTHLGLAPREITSKLGIPSSVTQSGIMFGANYHF